MGKQNGNGKSLESWIWDAACSIRGAKDDDVRWQFGVPPKGNANVAWVQHFIHHLAPRTAASPQCKIIHHAILGRKNIRNRET